MCWFGVYKPEFAPCLFLSFGRLSNKLSLLYLDLHLPLSPEYSKDREVLDGQLYTTTREKTIKQNI